MFTPKYVYIHPKSKQSSRTKEILARIHTHSPNAVIKILPKSGFDYPEGMPARDKFNLMKESVIISERTVPFIRTFASPGNIVERLTTVCNLTNMCCTNCEYCYLQAAQSPEHYIYTNRNELKKELASSSYAHWAILTIWTMYSFGLKALLMKLPENFMEVADRVREYFVDHRIRTDKAAIDYIYGKQTKIYEELKAGLSQEEFSLPKETFKLSRDIIEQFYVKNKEYPLVLTISEFADIFAIDHLTGNLSFMMGMLEEYPELQMTARTKSAYVDEMVKYNGYARMRVKIGLNTDHIIKEYEHGTSSLEERIEAARRIQESNGIELSLAIEPVITYDGDENDYKKMIEQTMKHLDPNKIRSITVGSVRYRPQLKSAIQMHFPSTTLFDASQNLQDPVGEDQRLRYSVNARVDIYSKIRDMFKNYTKAPFKLGSETPEVWDKLNMDRVGIIGTTVYQYTGKPDTPNPPKNESSVDKESDKKMTSKNTFSLAFRVARQSFSDNDEGIDEQKFETAENDIEAMIEDEIEIIDGKECIVPAYNYWRDVRGMRFREILKNRKVWAPVKIVGTLQQIGLDYPGHLDVQGKDDPEELTLVKLRLTDLDGTDVQCIPFPLEELSDDIRTSIQTQQHLTIYGAIVPVSIKNRFEYKMFLRFISTDVEIEDIISVKPTDDYRDHPAVKFSECLGTKRIIEYVKQRLVTGLGIMYLDKLPELDLAMEFIILQALSQGKKTYSFKLHSLVVGSPGVGKSLLTDAAKILNPICEEISGSSRKITPAGLIGSMGRDGYYKNGVLPRNSQGCVCIQDFQTIQGNSRNEVLGIFSKMMEDGEVVDSTSARITLVAETSIHLDMNRKSQLDRTGHYSGFSDIGIPPNFISRLDFILDISEDEQRQKELAKTIAGSEETRIEDKNWKDELKRLIAFLRSNYKEVRYASDVEQYRVDRYEKLMENVLNKYGSIGGIRDMQTRLARSIKKYIKAIATAYATNDVTKEMVDYAFKFIEKKVEFLFTLEENTESEELSLELVKNIFQQLGPAISNDDERFYNTEQVFDRYVSGKRIIITNKNRGIEKSKLSKLLRENYKIVVKTKYIAKAKKELRCYMLNKDHLEQFDLIKDSRQSVEKILIKTPKKVKVRPSIKRHMERDKR